ncbi:MAG: cupin domain-containing protein [Gammaproteobacteria bacterium]|nr:cupin domain-containing protein [Gammaproteobacteria bacterium]
MVQSAESASRLSALTADRLVRYGQLKPCTTAFIDTRTPGSAKKENFTIIGPGVAENPDQHVHIEIPHGFNIGAARQPPRCINSQHSHETAEVFIIHSGRWAFYLGENADQGEVLLGPGDTISIPVDVFRGFENVGDDTGFMFAVLGENDPGHVTWAPYVFAAAKKHGLILLEDGSLIDTAKGETIPPGKAPMPATTRADVASLRNMTAAELGDCVVRASELGSVSSCAIPGLQEYPVIGGASPSEGLTAGRMSWAHGFHVRHIVVDRGVETKTHSRAEEEVILMHHGTLTVGTPDGDVDLEAGDVFTVPIGLSRFFANRSDIRVEAFVVRGGNQPAAATITN